MNQAALTQLEIHRELAFLPEAELQALKIVIDKMIGRADDTERRAVSLKGIWRNKGFERLDDLESALHQVRTEMSTAILQRTL